MSKILTQTPQRLQHLLKMVSPKLRGVAGLVVVTGSQFTAPRWLKNVVPGAISPKIVLVTTMILPSESDLSEEN